MGMFDYLPGGQQVKCWDCILHEYKIGDYVPRIDDYLAYAIALREGGYACVVGSRLHSIRKKPLKACLPVIFDKYGNPFDPDEWIGPLGDKYFDKED